MLLLLGPLGLPGLAQAATYTYRSDAFAWESAANTVRWDNACTGYPNDDDQATLVFTGGFTFRFAGVNHASVRVLANGMLQFGPDTGLFRTYTNTTLPAAAAGARAGCVASATTATMMAYWTDLDPGRAGSGRVTWEQKGTAPNRRVVVSWNDVYQYNTSTPYTFQIILFENGEFKYQYGNANATGSNATIGVQVSDTDHTLYSFRSGYNANGSAIRWFIPSGAPARIAEYRFDENAWNGAVGEVRDSSGNGFHGTATGGAASTAAGQVCRALSVPANTTTASAAVDSAVDVDTTLGSIGTLSFWYASNTAWTTGTAMLADATIDPSRGFHLSRQSGGALRLSLTDRNGTALAVTAPGRNPGAGVWTHIAATWSLRAGTNQSVLRLYVNGAQVAIVNGTTSGALDPSLGSLFIGDNRSAFLPSGGTDDSANGRIDEMRMYNFELSPAEIALDIAQGHDCAPPLHHLELRHPTGTGPTCSPSALTLAACMDAACTTLYTGGVQVTMTGGAGITWPDSAAVTIPAGSGTATVRMQMTTPGAAPLGATATSPVATQATTCDFGSPGCTWTATDSALVLTVADHVAETPGTTLRVAAVRRSDASAQCVPAFVGARTVQLACEHVDPAAGTQAVRVAGTALNAAAAPGAACDATGRAVALTFDATGTATVPLAYADAGRIGLTARYTGGGATGDPGLQMSGTARFVAAPASFGFSAVTGGTIRAGSPFSATVTALNAAGAPMPAFGREAAPQGPRLSHVRVSPTGAGASDGVFSGNLGAFSGGSATAAALTWSEVGRIDLRADLAGYLGSALSVAGRTGTDGLTVGRFIPHHFDVTATPACGTFSYAGQPFAVTVTAMNGLPVPSRTVNHDGGGALSPATARAVTLADAAGLGRGDFGGTEAVPASRFVAGMATAPGVTYRYTTPLAPPGSLALRATDADGVSSAGHAEAPMPLRSGRLWLASGTGPERQPLALAVQAQHWSGQAWVLNSLDHCTRVPAAAVALSGALDHRGVAATWTSSVTGAIALTAGQGTLVLAAPTPAGTTGRLDVALNLGGGAADQSCLAAHPATTGAALPWLRSRHGACATTFDRDPAARASFGIASPETRRTMHVRELY